MHAALCSAQTNAQTGVNQSSKPRFLPGQSGLALTGRLMLAASTSLLAFAASSPAFAQQAAEEESDVVVVTAQRVSQNVQDVPIAVTAISGARLVDSGTNSLENLGDLVPSVSFRKGTTNANSAIMMRGVGTITFSVAAEPSVSTVVDGVVLSRSGQAFSDLVDVQRMEVLRGPQGSLFGKNASAGLINIVSRGGADSLEADLRIESYEGDEFRMRGTVAGPLGEGFTGRLTAFTGNYDGNITNIFGGRSQQINGYDRSGVRGIVDWQGDGVSVRAIADWFQSDDNCCAEMTGISRGASLDALLGYPTAVGITQRTVNHNITTLSRDEQSSLTLSSEFDLPANHTLSVIAGARKWDNFELREGDYLPFAVIGANDSFDTGTVETTQYSLEARIASDQTQALAWQAGAFYWTSNNTQDFTRQVTTCATSTLAALPGGAIPCNLTDTTNTIFPTATSRSDVDLTNMAVFGQATYRLTPQISLTGGLRLTRDELSFVHTRAPGVNRTNGLPAAAPGVLAAPAGGLTTAAIPGNGTNVSRNSGDNTNVSGRFVAQYEPTEDLMFYASYTRGYKGPAFNVFFNHVAPTNAVPIDEEISDSLEAGFKAQFLDRRLTINGAVFDVVYDGFQANNFIVVGSPPQFTSNLTNAGTVASTGYELDISATPIQDLVLRASVAYADARIEEFNPNPQTNAPDARNGTKLPLAPEWSYTISADWEADLGESLRLYTNASYAYTDDHFSELGQIGPIDSYGIINASIGIGAQDDRYRLTLVGRNLGDEQYVTLNTGTGLRYHIPRDADRYFGLTFAAKFR
jgi:iron complex outermembrane recepter protein